MQGLNERVRHVGVPYIIGGVAFMPTPDAIRSIITYHGTDGANRCLPTFSNNTDHVAVCAEAKRAGTPIGVPYASLAASPLA
jgi:hypothetical protein